ncbi:MAG TPA: TetR/AcrR family transcriptional regulator [Micromonosporaceae bacterium]|jgi:AcrR family transcriptional regulator|nr:TetR/AcrR family transcriptional regulator [Micromonosporaceae bacterium]
MPGKTTASRSSHRPSTPPRSVSSSAPQPRLSARERLLAAANELFYEEGVTSVGIDRVIERAGVAKASLYNTFGSKDELVRSYLALRHERRKERLRRGLERYDAPADKLLGVYDVLADLFMEPWFRGCPFINASADARPGSAVEQIRDESRAWIRALLTDLARQAGAADPDRLGHQLVLLYDGATVGAQLDHEPSAAAAAREAAAALIKAATA